MKRIAILLAVASIPTTSVAAPPFAGPVDVVVTNPSLPVEVVNADPVPVNLKAVDGAQLTHMGVAAVDHVTVVLGSVFPAAVDCGANRLTAIRTRADGTIGGQFVVPEGKAFVLTDVGAGWIERSEFDWSTRQLLAIHIIAKGATGLDQIVWQSSFPRDGLRGSAWADFSIRGGSVVGPGKAICAEAGFGFQAAGQQVFLANFSKAYGYLVDYSSGQ